jgi:hypothetical protein
VVSQFPELTVSLTSSAKDNTASFQMNVGIDVGDASKVRVTSA